MTRALLAAVLFLCLITSAWAGSDEGVSAYERRDFVTALKEFQPLAAQGEAASQLYLGYMLLKGNGVPTDYALAVKWILLAAEQDNALAQFTLGQMYSDGEGVPQDYVEAVKWYRVAADQGLNSAQGRLGDIYSKGEGVTQDNIQAHIWYNLAAVQGPNGWRSKRSKVAKQMTPAEISEAQRLALEWFEKHGQ